MVASATLLSHMCCEPVTRASGAAHRRTRARWLWRVVTTRCCWPGGRRVSSSSAGLCRSAGRPQCCRAGGVPTLLAPLLFCFLSSPLSNSLQLPICWHPILFYIKTHQCEGGDAADRLCRRRRYAHRAHRSLLVWHLEVMNATADCTVSFKGCAAGPSGMKSLPTAGMYQVVDPEQASATPAWVVHAACLHGRSNSIALYPLGRSRPAAQAIATPHPSCMHGVRRRTLSLSLSLTGSANAAACHMMLERFCSTSLVRLTCALLGHPARRSGCAPPHRRCCRNRHRRARHRR